MNVTKRNECEEIFAECRRRGVTLFVEDGELGYKPKARMSRGLLYKIKQDKEAVVQSLIPTEPTAELNPNVLIVPAKGPRKTPFEPGPDTERDQLIRRALTYLSGRGVAYVPLDVQEDIEASYEDDSLEEFRQTVRGWVKELVRAKRRAA